MLAFQIHLIARGDNTAKVMKKNLERSNVFKDLLMVKLAWSKNVVEERDCPKQMVMGSRNPKFCVLVNLAIYLEKWLREDGTTSQWLFADGVTDQRSPEKEQDKEINRCKNYCAKVLKAIINDPMFERSPMTGKLGTHSV